MREQRLEVHTPTCAWVAHLGAEASERSLADVLASAGHPLNKRCGGRGLCSGCEVHLQSGSVTPLSRLGDASLGAAASAREGGPIKACQVRMDSEFARIAIPARSLLAHAPSIVSDFKLGIPWGRDPLCPSSRHGIAVDIGTTTVALLVCDRETGRILAEASAFNAQIRHGEDVLTRIQACTTDPGALARLQRAVVADTLNPLIAAACSKAGIAQESIGIMVVAANTTMLHLLAGVDPSPMGVHPFHAVFLGHRVLAAAELGMDLGCGKAEVHLLPSPAAYVGADLAAGIVATGLLWDEGPSMLVDVGTNGEIIAKVGNRLVGCATAAGPAFEGAGLSSGSRGVHGAIERIQLRKTPFEPVLGVIGDCQHPVGICGSAYVDFLWEAREKHFLTHGGRFTPQLLAAAEARIEAGEFGKRLRLHPNGTSGPIWISEVDIAHLLQAKAAVAAGIDTLLRLLHVSPGQIKKLHLAGGFGLHLSLPHAIGCGLLPGFRPEQIEMVGNTSLGGAFLALNDRSLLDETRAVCARLETVELNLQPDFEDTYIDHLSLS